MPFRTRRNQTSNSHPSNNSPKSSQNATKSASQAPDRPSTSHTVIDVKPPVDPSRLSNSIQQPASGLLRPESAASPRRPQSSSGHLSDSRPTISRQASSSAKGTANGSYPTNPRRYSSVRYASDPQIAVRYRNHGMALDSPDSDAAPAPTIGITSSPQGSPGVDSSSRRMFKSLGHQLSFRSRSQLVAEGRLPPEQDHTAPLGGAHDGSSSWPEYVFSRRSESSAPSRVSGGSAPRPHSRGGTKSSAAPGLFRLGRRKPAGSLFPLPVKVSSQDPKDEDNAGARDSTSTPVSASTENALAFQDPFPGAGSKSAAQQGQPNRVQPPQICAPLSAIGSAQPTVSIGRNSSAASAGSGTSTPASQPPPRPSLRSRSSTVNSQAKRLESDRVPTPHVQESGRSSTASTTLGRNSIAGLRSLTSRLRHPSETYSPRHGSPGSGAAGTSANNSFALSRETLVVPDREEGETAGKYFQRLEKDIPKKSIALVLSKSSDTFSHDVLRSLMRTFKFFEEPMDMSMRRFLWEIDLPGEAQQIDRVISAFAERYHECNPHIFNTLDEAYLIAYSLIILHSDLFNKNNKHKMQRGQYQKNTGGQGIPEEILGYFYDNIQYTEFIAQDADAEEGDRKSKSASRKARKVKARLAANEAAKNGKLDPYDIIIDDKLKLDILRPSLREVLNVEDTYSYFGTAKVFNVPNLRNAFSRYGTLQVVSARSRPEAFMSPSTMFNPNDAHPGVVDINVAKVGILWRKEAKRKKTRSPWQEWGAVLTQSQLFFFKNASWVKGLCHQVESHQKHAKAGAVVFKPPLEQFRYDNKVPTTDAVALLDFGYKRHKHAFVLARRGDVLEENLQENYFEEVLLADNEAEMNDWIAKVNYAAAYRTANVRMRSWHAISRRGQGMMPPPRENGQLPQNPRIPPEQITTREESDHQPTDARHTVASRKVTGAEEEIILETNKLEDQLRTARHLQILAPFPTRTRSELLTYGARLAHNIRWSRYDIARLKCQRDILIRDLKEDDGRGAEHHIEALPVHTSSSGADATLAPHAPALVRNASSTTGEVGLSADDPPLKANTSREADFLGGIDEAFAIPPETLSRFATPSEGPFKLLPISYDVSGSHVVVRQNSSSSLGSRQGTGDPAKTSESPTPTQSVRDSERDRPSTAAESDKEQQQNPSNPESRSRYRRSLQRTLREPREGLGSQNSRSKKGKDAASSMSGDDSGSVKDGESLARKPGSFTVHGKKASIITFGSELQHMSAEERLRYRKMAKTEDSRHRATSGSRQGSESRADSESAATGDGLYAADSRSLDRDEADAKPESLTPRPMPGRFSVTSIEEVQGLEDGSGSAS